MYPIYDTYMRVRREQLFQVLIGLHRIHLVILFRHIRDLFKALRALRLGYLASTIEVAGRNNALLRSTLQFQSSICPYEDTTTGLWSDILS